MRIAIGFDGSSTDDWTALRCETMSGWQFTPTYGPDKRPTIWNPAEFGGKIPRGEVYSAVSELFAVHTVLRMYCDPPHWSSEIEAWALEFGEKVVIGWETYRATQMHSSLLRFVTDLSTGELTHDGCPITKEHIANARKVPRPGERYILAKPHGAYHQKIDAAMASVLAHEAAADARAAGLADEPDSEMTVWL